MTGGGAPHPLQQPAPSAQPLNPALEHQRREEAELQAAMEVQVMINN